MKPDFKNITVHKIDPSPFQKRNYFDADKLKDLAASIKNDGLIEPIIVRFKTIQNSLDRQSKVSEKSQLLLHKFVQQLEKIFKKLPKRLEWKSFYVHDFPLVREICEDIRKISLENKLNKSQIKAISEDKKSPQEVYQHIVNNTESFDTPKIENINQGEKTASIFPLRDMSARGRKQAAEKINWKNEGAKHPAPDIDATKAQIIECNFVIFLLM